MEIPALPMHVHAINIRAKTAISKFMLFKLDSFICRKLYVLTEVEWYIVTTGRFELDSIYTRGYLIFRSCICRFSFTVIPAKSTSSLSTFVISYGFGISPPLVSD